MNELVQLLARKCAQKPFFLSENNWNHVSQYIEWHLLSIIFVCTTFFWWNLNIIRSKQHNYKKSNNTTISTAIITPKQTIEHSTLYTKPNCQCSSAPASTSGSSRSNQFLHLMNILSLHIIYAVAAKARLKSPPLIARIDSASHFFINGIPLQHLASSFQMHLMFHCSITQNRLIFDHGYFPKYFWAYISLVSIL